MKLFFKNLFGYKKIKLHLTYLIILIFCITFLFLIYYTRKIHKYDGIKINMTGQQRMLIQKLAKEIILHKLDNSSKFEIENTINLIENNHNAIANGGKVFTDTYFKNYRIIPPTKKQKIKTQLEDIKKLWVIYKNNVNIYLEHDTETSFQYILNYNLVMLEEIDLAVQSMQESFEINENIIGTSLYASITFIFSMFIFLLISRVIKLRTASLRIQRLESFLPICSYCKKIRKKEADPNNKKSWIDLESYLREKDNTKVTHGLCPDCFENLYSKYIDEE